jgi:hypothetical protein
VAMNKGFAVSDTLIYLPLLILALIGLMLRRFWGFFAMTGALAISAYWPIACLVTLFFSKNIPTFHFKHYTSYTIILLFITIFSIWGLFYLYKKRHIITRP